MIRNHSDAWSYENSLNLPLLIVSLRHSHTHTHTNTIKTRVHSIVRKNFPWGNSWPLVSVQLSKLCLSSNPTRPTTIVCFTFFLLFTEKIAIHKTGNYLCVCQPTNFTGQKIIIIIREHNKELCCSSVSACAHTPLWSINMRADCTRIAKIERLLTTRLSACVYMFVL